MKKQRKNAGSILRMAVALSLVATLLPLPAYAKTHYGGTHSSPNEAGRTLEDLVKPLPQPPDPEKQRPSFEDALSDAKEQSDPSNDSESNATDDDPEEESPDSVSQEDAEAANEATTAQENEHTTRHRINIDNDDKDNVDEGDDQEEDETEYSLVLLVVTATGIALIAAIFNYIVKRKKND